MNDPITKQEADEVEQALAEYQAALQGVVHAIQDTVDELDVQAAQDVVDAA